MKDENFEIYISILKEEGHIPNESWEKYYRKHYSRAVKLSDGYVGIEKSRIETHFCFGYRLSSYDSEEYDNANKMVEHARNSAEYFKNKNLEGLNRQIERLSDKSKHFEITPQYWKHDDNTKLRNFSEYDLWRGIDKDAREITDEDRELLVKALKEELADFNKRLDTYLKRYGTSKLKTWSYWVDE